MKKTIVLGVSGGIAAFKAAQLTSNLIKKGYDVEVIMTKNATQFITPLTFESLTKHNVMVDTFEKVADRSVKHISIAQRADLFVIIPATANIIAKVVYGIADDMLSTTFLAAKCPKVICPAMNTNMYENPVTQRNLKMAIDLGYELLEPEKGYLACGDVGTGKLADIAIIERKIEEMVKDKQILKGKKVLISAGPTQESIDPVRFITNHSTGKMGYEIARAAIEMGADVTLVSGPVSIMPPSGAKVINIQSAQQMFEAIKANYEEQDFIIKAAAVGDYRAEVVADEKIKKNDDNLQIRFVKNEDILAYLGAHKKPTQVLCGFAMETENLIANAQSKLIKKNADMIVANNLRVAGAGFASDTNVASFILEDHIETQPKMSKYALGVKILHKLIELQKEKGGYDVSSC